MKNALCTAIDDCMRAIEQLKEPAALRFMEETARLIADCFNRGNKVIIAGNGGSLCDASHFAEELTGVFRKKRKALPAIALSDPGHLTCAGNDFGFDYVFARAIEAYGKKDDLFIGLTTSGNSTNMVLAFERARELGLTSLAFLGKDGGKLKGYADLELLIEGFETSDRIQEAHMTALHIMIELVEELLFGYSAQLVDEVNQPEEGMLKQIVAAVRG